MLISYPILPANAANQSDQAKFDAMVALTQPTRGLYPITTGNRWHGGIHLTPGTEPIRAIADGVIVAYRLAPATKDYPGQGLYDTSFVLIKHDTHSGENTQVVYYSLYMHLAPKGSLTDAQRSQMMPFLRNAATGESATQAPANTRVWRKEVLGFGGQLYGVPTVHFEIFTTEADLARFWRDASAVAAGGHGSNDVFGDTHFILPANLNFVARHPHAVAPHRIDLPGHNQFYELPIGIAGQSTESLHVVVELSEGHRIATTYRLDAQGKLAGQIGLPVRQDDYEYEIFRLATKLYADCPSAGYEYLRFGRILSSDTTTHTENWQLIRYAENAIGYINLADPGHNVIVLSDADFPDSWQKLSEGRAASPEDGIANVDGLTQLLHLPASPSEPSLSAAPSFLSRASDASVIKLLRHFICKHPSEWDTSDIDTRYAVLKQPGKPLNDPTAWKNFKDHVEAMAFWPQTGLADRSVWHFHPLTFINHYMKCGWLSVNEFARCLPRRSLSDRNLVWNTALTRATTHSIHYNKYIRKFCGNSRKRLAHNLAQSYIETGILSLMEEGGAGNGHPYTAFFGRGYHQLTWAGNYRGYGEFKNLPQHTGAYSDRRITRTSQHPLDSGGTLITWSPRYDPATISSDLDHAGESSGFFWASKSFRGKKNMNRVADLEFNESSVGFCCWLINGGGAGYSNRQQFAKFLANILLDEPLKSGQVNFTYPALSPPGNPALCASFPPATVPYTERQIIDYEPQIPPV
ncbi:M23 family metallopeptidase [Xanthomonas translucens]|uniref:M23 family metallopeptidase n=2 Tax=Xanthomonas campestris pv. translucens TaxID=343 RepID=UPI0009BB4F47|nr:M23 family metallopeptidase [Xanthomonas translucens]MCT8272493.1 M23 family metallopeptidase [Xanthomonas translucens pv. undulosa]WLA07584.1 M23 family metallopeptidase [Xanthomonas translucens]WNJ31809.1 M23 family metallopeptidase [Xanthomonas translucens pv. undulosa]